MKAFFSVPGLFFFLVLAIMYFTLMGAFAQVFNQFLPGFDSMTQLVVSLILPIIPIALLIGYYRSIVNPDHGYAGIE